MKHFLLVSLLGLLAVLAVSAQEVPLHRFVPQTSQDLQAALRFADQQALPVVSAHRGGPGPGFPENGADIIETDIPVLLWPLLYREASAPVAHKGFFELR